MAVAEPRLEIKGWLVAQVEPERGFGETTYQHGGRLFLFRTATDWTLLSVRTTTRWGSDDRPEEGWATASAQAYADLEELKAGVERSGRDADWRELVRVGASTPNYDVDLMRLWAPVQIDLDLEKSSIHVRELGARGERRQQPGWEEEALALAVARLEELGFVVLEVLPDPLKLFPSRLVRGWSNRPVGALRAAAHGCSVRLLVAVDGFGEVYTRSGDSTFDPGARRRYPPRPLTEWERKRVEVAYQQRRSEQLRPLEEERS
jgi:hypothetical protein